MSRLSIVFSKGVVKEIRTIYQWYEERRESLGEDFLLELESVYDRIQRSPDEIAPIHGEIRRARLERFPYAVYYRVESRRISVLAVMHGKRDPDSWPGRN